jgi:F-type H+-transporting ATPase subunit delta
MIFKMTADRYAGALYSVASDAGRLDSVRKDIKTVSDILLQLPEVRTYCMADNISKRDAETLLNVAFLPNIKSAECANALNIMAENQRLSSLPFLPEAFSAISAEREGRVTVSAEFANSPELETVEKLKKKMSQKTGKTVKLNLSVNPELLGGFILKWNNNMLDNSARGRLKQMLVNS